MGVLDRGQQLQLQLTVRADLGARSLILILMKWQRVAVRCIAASSYACGVIPDSGRAAEVAQGGLSAGFARCRFLAAVDVQSQLWLTARVRHLPIQQVR